MALQVLNSKHHNAEDNPMLLTIPSYDDLVSEVATLSRHHNYFQIASVLSRWVIGFYNFIERLPYGFTGVTAPMGVDADRT